MNLNDEYDKLFLITDEIVNSYNELLLLSIFDEDSIDRYFLLFEKLEDLVKKEFEYYNKFEKKDLSICLNKLSNMNENEMDLKNVRIGFRLSCIYDRITNNTINLKELFPQFNIDIELGIFDLNNSKIVIDTYKLINNKLNALVCYDDKSNMDVDRLSKLNMQNAIYKISMYETSELLGLISLYDLDSIISIDFKMIDEKYYKKFGKKIDIHSIVKDKFYTTSIELINRLNKNGLDGNNIVNIYDNLYLVSQLEILFDYLSISELFKISMYFDNTNIDSKLIVNNVKSLIRNQFNKRRK